LADYKLREREQRNEVSRGGGGIQAKFIRQKNKEAEYREGRGLAGGEGA